MPAQSPAWDAFQEWYRNKFGQEIETTGSMAPNPNDPGLKPPLYPGGKSYSDAPLAASNAISTGGFVDAGYRPRNAANPSAMDMLLAGGWNPSKQDINPHFDKLVEQEKQKLMQELPGQTPE